MNVPLTYHVYIQLFEIVELLAQSAIYHVCNQVGMGPSRLLLAIVNVVRPVKDDQDNGISHCKLLLLSLSVVSFLRLDHDDGSSPVIHLPLLKLIVNKLDKLDHDDGSSPVRLLLYKFTSLKFCKPLQDGKDPVRLDILLISR